MEKLVCYSQFQEEGACNTMRGDMGKHQVGQEEEGAGGATAGKNFYSGFCRKD